MSSTKEYQKAWRAKHREQSIAYSKAYRLRAKKRPPVVLTDKKHWVCECGAVPNGFAAEMSWRFNEERWEHCHGPGNWKRARCLALRAWAVTVEGEVSVIVYAPTATRARALGWTSDWFIGTDFIDLRARLIHELKPAAQAHGRERIMEGNTQNEQRIMRELGWYEYDRGAADSCDGCGLYEWEGIPESRIEEVGEDLLCVQCRINTKIAANSCE